MPAVHVLRALLLILGFLAVLPIQVQDAGAVGTSASVIRDCSAPCGVKAKNARSDAARVSAVVQASGQSAPDDGFVPIPAFGPSLTEGIPAAPFRFDPIHCETVSPTRLDRPPKSA